MSIYHCSVKMIKRSDGRSSVAAAAYRSGETIVNEQDGIKHNYSMRKGVLYTKILAPVNSPVWARERSKLWNEVEKSETRVNSQTAREVEVALPIEFSLEQSKAVLDEYCAKFVADGMIVDYAIHQSHGKHNNPHAHILLTTRECNQNGFTKKNRDWNSKEYLAVIRESWAIVCNKVLDTVGAARISEKSNADRGIEDLPTVHEGYFVKEYRAGKKQSQEVREIAERIIAENDSIRAANAERKELNLESAKEQNKREIAELESAQENDLRDFRMQKIAEFEQLAEQETEYIERLERNLDETLEEKEKIHAKIDETIAEDEEALRKWHETELARYQETNVLKRVWSWIFDEHKEREKRIETNKQAKIKNDKKCQEMSEYIEKRRAAYHYHYERTKEKIDPDYALEKAREASIEAEKARIRAEQARLKAEEEERQRLADAERARKLAKQKEIERSRLSKLSLVELMNEIKRQGGPPNDLQLERLQEIQREQARQRQPKHNPNRGGWSR